MKHYIDKSDIIAEIDRELESISNASTNFALGRKMELAKILSFINTLEVKEIHEDIDLDLNPIFEEFDIDPDSRFASMFKEGFYKGVDRYLNKKEGKV